MDRLRQWVRRKFTDVEGYRNDLKEARDRESKQRDLAFWSLHNTHTLSPPSTEQPPSIQTAAFFKLPSEIRLAILKEAFGDRTVHMHIHSRTPWYSQKTRNRRPPSDETPNIHYAGSPTASSSVGTREIGNRSWFPVRRGDLHEGWFEWCSRVCQHNWQRTVNLQDANADPLRSDRCLTDKPVHDDGRPGDGLSKDTMIGCTGWLLTCRQAYVEAVDVLYGTNTFVLSSHGLIEALLVPPSLNLDILIPPPHLHMVRSLCIQRDLAYFADPLRRHTKSTDDRAKFTTTLDRLPRTFPNLTSLYISLTGNLYGFGSLRTFLNQDEFEQELVYPLSEMAGRLQSLHPLKFVLEFDLPAKMMVLPSVLPVYTPPKRRQPQQGKGYGTHPGPVWEREWHWWDPESKGDGKARKGFWLNIGYDDHNMIEGR